MRLKSYTKSNVTNSTYDQIDKQLQILTMALWFVAGASVVSMFLAIACAIFVILSR
ncbi:MAG: hypothetical protein IJT57_02470 [Selenomonadaceae bacterium]|nr:hypothetical protein [Selenomonadaceae bacterium]